MSESHPTSDPIGQRELGRILDQLRRSFEGDAWHGPAVREVVAGLTGSHAAREVVPGGHTIWEIVQHIGVWEDEVRRRIQGAPARTLPPALDWPPMTEPTEAAWRRVLDDLEEGHTRLMDAVARLTEDKLDTPLAGDRGTRWTFYTTLHGIVQHNLYHAGQIALLRKALP
jgi:uncharacterized damage-inducible protein DinB